MTRQLAMEGGPLNIRANTISPGLIETAATKPRLDDVPGFKEAELSRMMLPRVGMPEDVAYCATFLASDESSWVTASDFKVDGGATCSVTPPDAADDPRRHQLDEAQLAGRGAGAFSAVLLAYVALQTGGVAIIPVVTPFLQSRFTLSDAQIGLLTSAFALAVALVAIPMGLASARWGGPTLFAAAALLVSGSLVLAAAGSYEWLLIGRFIQGLGAGSGIPVGTALITRFVTPAWRHRAFGLFGAGTGVGTVLTLLILPSVATAGGYRAVFLTVALIGVLLAVAVASQRALRSRPAQAEVPDVRRLVRALGRAARSGSVLLIAVVNFTTLGLVVGIFTWTPQYLHDQYGTTFAAAAYLTAAIGVAQIVGNPLGSLAMTRWGKVAVLVVGLIVTALTTALVSTGFGIAFSFAAVLAAVLVSGAVYPTDSCGSR